MKIVRFKNGKYGIRKFTLCGYIYKDFSHKNSYWWGINNRYFLDCQESKEIVIETFDCLTDKGVPIS